MLHSKADINIDNFFRSLLEVPGSWLFCAALLNFLSSTHLQGLAAAQEKCLKSAKLTSPPGSAHLSTFYTSPLQTSSFRSLSFSSPTASSAELSGPAPLTCKYPLLCSVVVTMPFSEVIGTNNLQMVRQTISLQTEGR